MKDSEIVTGDESNGCETDLYTDINHCGECNKQCRTKNVKTILCENRMCNYDECLISYIDADADRTNGCEEWSYFPKIYRTVNINNYIYSFHYYNNSYFIAFITQDKSTNEMATNITKTDINGNIVWSKSSKIFTIPSKILTVGNNIIFIGTMFDNGSGKLIVVSFKEDGELVNSFEIKSNKSIAINNVTQKDGNLFLLGDIKVDDLTKSGLLIKYNTSSDITAKRFYTTSGNPSSVNFSLYNNSFLGNSIILLGNRRVVQMQNSYEIGYLIKLSNDLNAEKTFTFPEEQKISFNHIGVNSFNKVILSGIQNKIISGNFNAGLILKLLINDNSVSVEKSRLLYIANRSTHFDKFILNSDNIYLIGFSYIPDNFGVKDLTYNLIKFDKDVNLAASKSFYSDLFSAYSALGLPNILTDPTGGILTNIYFLIPNEPVRSAIVAFNMDIENKYNCPTKFVYDSTFQEFVFDQNFTNADMNSADVNIDITPLSLQFEECKDIESITYCKEH